MKYKLLFAALASAALSTLAIGNQKGPAQPKPQLTGATDKDPLTYRPNESMAFTLTPHGNGTAIRWKRTGDDGKEEKGEAEANAPVQVETSLDRPGFVRMVAELIDASGKTIARFDGGAGWTWTRFVPTIRSRRTSMRSGRDTRRRSRKCRWTRRRAARWRADAPT